MARQSWDFVDVMSEDAARKLAAPYLSVFRRCIEDAIRAVQSRESSDPEFFHVYPAGARATLIYWQIVDRAETRFSDMPGVTTSHNRRFLTILIGDKLEIRFKKLDRKGRSRNYRTKTQVRYQLQLRLAGMEEPTKATAGYQLNIDGTLKDILMACPRGERTEWMFSLPVDGGNIAAHPATAPDADDGDKPSVRPKQA
jgi:hypothetical protein